MELTHLASAFVLSQANLSRGYPKPLKVGISILTFIIIIQFKIIRFVNDKMIKWSRLISDKWYLRGLWNIKFLNENINI